MPILENEAQRRVLASYLDITAAPDTYLGARLRLASLPWALPVELAAGLIENRSLYRLFQNLAAERRPRYVPENIVDPLPLP